MQGDVGILALEFIPTSSLGAMYHDLQVPYVMFFSDDLEYLSEDQKILTSQIIYQWLDAYPVQCHPLWELDMIYQAMIELGIADYIIDSYFS